jgi:hypothetical protein
MEERKMGSNEIPRLIVDENTTNHITNRYIPKINKRLDEYENIVDEKVKRKLKANIKVLLEGLTNSIKESKTNNDDQIEESTRVIEDIEYTIEQIEEINMNNVPPEDETEEEKETRIETSNELNKILDSRQAIKTKVSNIVKVTIDDITTHKKFKYVDNKIIELLKNEMIKLVEINDKMFQEITILEKTVDNNAQIIKTIKSLLQQDSNIEEIDENNINNNNNNNDQQNEKLRTNQVVPKYNFTTESINYKSDEIPTKTIEWEKFRKCIAETLSTHMWTETFKTAMETERLYKRMIGKYIESFRGSTDPEKDYVEMYQFLIESSDNTFEKYKSIIGENKTKNIMNEIRLLKNWIRANDGLVYKIIKKMISTAADRKKITNEKATRITDITIQRRERYAISIKGDDLNERMMGASILFHEARYQLSIAKDIENLKDLREIMLCEQAVSKFYGDAISKINNVVALFDRLDETPFRTEFTGRIILISNILDYEARQNSGLQNILTNYKNKRKDIDRITNELRKSKDITNEEKLEWRNRHREHEKKCRETYESYLNEVIQHLTERQSQPGAKEGVPDKRRSRDDNYENNHNNKNNNNNKRKNEQQKGNQNISGAQKSGGEDKPKKPCIICKKVGKEDMSHTPYHCTLNPHNDKFKDTNENWEKIKDIKLWNKPFKKIYWEKKTDDGYSGSGYNFNKDKYNKDGQADQ